MPDTHVEPPPRVPYDPSMEMRVSRLEEDMRDVRAIGSRLEGGLAGVQQSVTGLQQDVTGLKQSVTGLQQSVSGLQQSVSGLQQAMASVQQAITGLQQAVTRIEATLSATLPHLATKAELAEKPSKAYLVGLLAVLITAYAAGLAALAIIK